VCELWRFSFVGRDSLSRVSLSVRIKQAARGAGDILHSRFRRDSSGGVSAGGARAWRGSCRADGAVKIKTLRLIL